MFTFKGRHSSTMGLQASGELVLNSPSRDVNRISIAGRNGDLVMDNGRFESVVRSIGCRLIPVANENMETTINRIQTWLATDVRYHDFLWEADSDFVYRAMVEGSVNARRILPKFGRMVIDFRLHPIKILRSSMNERQVVSGTNIANPYELPAKPVIRVVGNGDLLLNIGNQVLDLRDILHGITVDCETMTVTNFDGTSTEFAKMYSTFPELLSGNNVITFDGNVQVFITPRLGDLV